MHVKLCPLGFPPLLHVCLKPPFRAVSVWMLLNMISFNSNIMRCSMCVCVFSRYESCDTVFTYQTVYAAQCVICIVERVGQLVHAIVCLAVAIETHTHRDAAKRRGMKGQVSL